VSTAGQWRQHDRDRDRADAELLRRAAAWVREHPDRAGYAGLSFIFNLCVVGEG
jgi:deferrochelatase/peroxidase EfeB